MKAPKGKWLLVIGIGRPERPGSRDTESTEHSSPEAAQAEAKKAREFYR